MCAWVLWKRDVIYLVGEEVRVARCARCVYLAWVLWKRGVIYLVGEEVRVARCVHACYGREV